MKRTTQQCIAAFAITGILIGALCGFVAVDLSTDRYMSGQFVSLFELTNVTPDGVELSLMGAQYLLHTAPSDRATDIYARCRGLLPGSVTLPAQLVAQGYRAAFDYIEETAPPEEPW